MSYGHYQTGRGSAEVAFDDYMDRDALIVSNMVSAMWMNHTSAQDLRNEGGAGTGTPTAVIQNAATSRHPSIPKAGRFAGAGARFGRVEPVASGGIEAKGLWISQDMGLRYNIPQAPRYNMVDENMKSTGKPTWFLGLFVAPHYGKGSRNLITLPNGARVILHDDRRNVRFRLPNGATKTIPLRSHRLGNASHWSHLGFLMRDDLVHVFVDGFEVGKRTLTGRWVAALRPHQGTALHRP